MIKNVLMSCLDIAQPPDLLKTALGSCVGVVVFDPDFEICGLAHIMLPYMGSHKPHEAAQFADQGIPTLVKKIKDFSSASQNRVLKAKIAGGSQMFQEVTFKTITSIGEQNIKAVRQVLKDLNIPILGEDLGGNKGRQLLVDASKRVVSVCEIGGKFREI